MMLTITASAQENLQRQASNKSVGKTFTTVKELPITSVKNQFRSGYLVYVTRLYSTKHNLPVPKPPCVAEGVVSSTV